MIDFSKCQYIGKPICHPCSTPAHRRQPLLVGFTDWNKQMDRRKARKYIWMFESSEVSRGLRDTEKWTCRQRGHKNIICCYCRITLKKIAPKCALVLKKLISPGLIYFYLIINSHFLSFYQAKTARGHFFPAVFFVCVVIHWHTITPITIVCVVIKVHDISLYFTVFHCLFSGNGILLE